MRGISYSLRPTDLRHINSLLGSNQQGHGILAALVLLPPCRGGTRVLLKIEVGIGRWTLSSAVAPRLPPPRISFSSNTTTTNCRRDWMQEGSRGWMEGTVSTLYVATTPAFSAAQICHLPDDCRSRPSIQLTLRKVMIRLGMQRVRDPRRPHWLVH